MGGKRCLNEEDRKERKRASARKYAKKNYATLTSPEAKKAHSEASMKWYWKNKMRRIAEQMEWNAKNKQKTRMYQKRAYYKRIGKPMLFIKKSSIIS